MRKSAHTHVEKSSRATNPLSVFLTFIASSSSPSSTQTPMNAYPPSHDSQSPAASSVNQPTCDPAVADPPSFPQQQWEHKQPTNDDFPDTWDSEHDDDSLNLHDWQSDHPGPSREQILQALQSVYHETGPSVDGAATSLNTVLQGPYFDDDSLSQLTGGGQIDAYALNLALRPFSLTLLPANKARSDTSPDLENAFLVYQFNRWFSLRRVGAHWLNLSERVLRPAQILPWDLSISLGQLQDDGCEVYVVKGKLPMCEADEGRFFEEHFHWCLNDGVTAEEETDCCDGVRDGECICYDSTDDTYEDELQAAIEASLADVHSHSHKKLVIKSPPTSLVSLEEGGAPLTPNGEPSEHVAPMVNDFPKNDVTQS